MLTAEPHRIEDSFRIYKLGERGSGYKPYGFVVQDFYRLRDECIAQKKLFTDPDFEANNAAVFGSKTPSFPIVWKRPPEISWPSTPRLTVEGATSFDIVQGKPGNCWMVSALANLTLLKPLFERVVPQDQNFDDKYAGIFHFRFWKFGKWIDVVIDDRLPTENGQLCFIHSSHDEFWSPLVEKAYAKLHGSYDALTSENPTEVMVDFTGGLTEIYKSDHVPHDFYHILYEAWERSSLIVAATHPVQITGEDKTPESLVQGHAYNITKLTEVNVLGESQKLLKIRNPWRNYERKGPLNDGSPQWSFMTPQLGFDVNVTSEDDGELWMSYEDFLKYFAIIEVCSLAPDLITGSNNKLNNNLKTWHTSVFEGKWVRGVSAGGCRNHLDSFARNPQYTIEVMDNDSKKKNSEEKCSVIIALMQKCIHGRHRHMKSIGFTVYTLASPHKLQKPLNKKFFQNNNSIGSPPHFVNTREVICRFTVPPGTYCIVPSTFYPKEEADFIIRVFTAKKHEMKENDSVVGNKESFTKQMIMTHSLYDTEEKTDSKVLELFHEFCDEHSELNDRQLGNLLLKAVCHDKMYSMNFDKRICCNMISMVDSNLSGIINEKEFRLLWDNIKHWMVVYKSFVKDHGHNLSSIHLRDALLLAGFTVNNHVLNILVQNYSNEKRELSFEDFLMCAVRLQVLINEIEEKDPQGVGEVRFLADELAEKMVSL